MESNEILTMILAAVPGVVAIAWLTFREIAPKTPWAWDDRVVALIEAAAWATADRMEEKARERKESTNA